MQDDHEAKLEKKRVEKEALRQRLRDRYWGVTTDDLPAVAAERGWPVDEGHCFQRIILDTICKGVWYAKIPEPAVAHMTNEQLRKAVRLAEDLLHGHRMLEPLNEQSIAWRRTARQKEFSESY